jgi:hypothetical protein
MDSLEKGCDMTLVPGLTLAIALFGQAPAETPEAFARAAGARLAYMKESVLTYEIRPADDPDRPYTLEREPVLRFNNPVGRSRDGTVFLWMDRNGRPAVVVQATLNVRGAWVHEFSSLATGEFTSVSPKIAEQWSPAQGGIEFKPLPGAPAPGATPEVRLAQMRDLARRFKLQDDFQLEGWQALRLLPKPFARFGTGRAPAIDGALFAYVLTTDPEAYLMLEARPGKPVPQWHYAFARSTGYPLKASWEGQVVWERGRSGPFRSVRNPFIQFQYSHDVITADPKAP